MAVGRRTVAGAAVLAFIGLAALLNRPPAAPLAPADASLPASPLPRPGCASWPEHDPNTICVVARTYVGHAPFLSTFVSALAHGRVPVRVLAVDTEPGRLDNATGRPWDLAGLLRTINANLGCPRLATQLKLRPEDLERHRIEAVAPGVKEHFEEWCQDGGHQSSSHARSHAHCVDRLTGRDYTLTDAALDAVLGPNNTDDPFACGYVLVTNGDNLYATAFGEHLLPWMEGGAEGPADLIAWDFVSRYDALKMPPEKDVVGVGPNHAVASYFYQGAIDLAAGMFRAAWFREQRLPDGSPVRTVRNAVFGGGCDRACLTGTLGLLTADGLLFHQLAKRLPSTHPGTQGRRRKVLVRRILVFHQ
ncbi:hypothetical protein DFJ74DRAFT_656016 [Hyaloraphidium curvatum]|nr:hypothetical protein DFJ74DRAFT_656016 [Hyaloraphidium curvatum]